MIPVTVATIEAHIATLAMSPVLVIAFTPQVLRKGVTMSRPHAGVRRPLALQPTRIKLVALLALAALVIASLSSLAVAQSSNCVNLVADGGFEDGAGWQTTTSGSYALLSDFQAYNGARAAHLAGVDGANDQLAVALNLPADKPNVTLSFWWYVQSEEVSGEYDGMTVVAADASGTPMRSLLTLGSESSATQWQQSSLDLSEFSGQAIQLKFVAQADSSLVSDFFVDDVAVTACGAAFQHRVFLPLTQR
jgi:hypothetical protein